MLMSVACVGGGKPSPTPTQGFIFNFLRAGSFSTPLGLILCAYAVPLALAYPQSLLDRPIPTCCPSST